MGRATEQLQLKYISLETAFEWELRGNAKLHNIPKISQSIRDNGFRDPPAFDNNLNGGKRGLAFGNGRTEALFAMQMAGEPPPRGILTLDSGKWAMPVLFGVDAQNEAAAKRFSIDHNNLTLDCRVEVQPGDLSFMFDPQMYSEMLQDLAKADSLPLTVSENDLDQLLASIGTSLGTEGSVAEVEARSPFSDRLPPAQAYQEDPNEDEDEDEQEEQDNSQSQSSQSGQSSAEGNIPSAPPSDGSMLALLHVTIGDPVSNPEDQDIWQLGRHILVCAHVFSQWRLWAGYLNTDDTLFVPYPGIYAVLSKKAAHHRLVMVQPNPYVAGHILDAYIQIHGAGSVTRIAQKVQP